MGNEYREALAQARQDYHTAKKRLQNAEDVQDDLEKEIGQLTVLIETLSDLLGVPLDDDLTSQILTWRKRPRRRRFT